MMRKDKHQYIGDRRIVDHLDRAYSTCRSRNDRHLLVYMFRRYHHFQPSCETLLSIASKDSVSRNLGHRAHGTLPNAVGS